MSEDKFEEVTLGRTKYIYKFEKNKDKLIDNSSNSIKINISFSRNPENNKKAKDGLKTFFTELYS
ncbi:hypothetical protein B1R38_27055 [Bacillus cereus]|nr:hypothetical protein B1R38_27055 [Bacillus cereus]